MAHEDKKPNPFTALADRVEQQTKDAREKFKGLNKKATDLAEERLVDAERDLSEMRGFEQNVTASNTAAKLTADELLDDTRVDVARLERAENMNPFVRTFKNLLGDKDADRKQIRQDIAFDKEQLALFNQGEVTRKNSLNDTLRLISNRNAAEISVFDKRQALTDTEFKAISQNMLLSTTLFNMRSAEATASTKGRIAAKAARTQFLSQADIGSLIELQSEASGEGKNRSALVGEMTLGLGEINTAIRQKRTQELNLRNLESSVAIGDKDLFDLNVDSFIGNMTVADMTLAVSNDGKLEVGGKTMTLPVVKLQIALNEGLEREDEISERIAAQDQAVTQTLFQVQQTSQEINEISARIANQFGVNRIPSSVKTTLGSAALTAAGVIPTDADGNVDTKKFKSQSKAISSQMIKSQKTVAEVVKTLATTMYPQDKEGQGVALGFYSGVDGGGAPSSNMLVKSLRGGLPESFKDDPALSSAWDAMENSVSTMLAEQVGANASLITDGMDSTARSVAFQTMLAQVLNPTREFKEDSQQVVTKAMDVFYRTFQAKSYEQFQVSAPRLAASVLVPQGDGHANPHAFSFVPPQAMVGFMSAANEQADSAMAAAVKRGEPLDRGTAYAQALLYHMQLYKAGERFSSEFETAADAYIDLMGHPQIREMQNRRINGMKNASVETYMAANGPIRGRFSADWDATADQMRIMNGTITGELLRDRGQVIAAYGNDSSARDSGILAAVADIVGITENQEDTFREAVRRKLNPPGPGSQSGVTFEDFVLNGKFEEPALESIRKQVAKEWVSTSKTTDALMVRMRGVVLEKRRTGN